MRIIRRRIAFANGGQNREKNEKRDGVEDKVRQSMIPKNYAYLINNGITFLAGISVRLMERLLVLTYTRNLIQK